MLPHEDLFQRLHDLTEIRHLVGTSEHLHLECKTWAGSENERQKALAKALCGFANADGGVLVVGLQTTTSPDKYTPDVIDATAPVPEALAVKSRIAGLVPELVEPPLAGVKVEAVREPQSAESGFVIVDVPPTDGPPCRSRKDWRFYVRINSGTYLMEYFQIEDMFGKRHRPRLALCLEPEGYRLDGTHYYRPITIGIENSGRGVAKFPSLRFQRTPGFNLDNYGIDGNGHFGLPLRPTEPELIVFGGGADDVIYPGTTLRIAKLSQSAKETDWNATRGGRQAFYLEEHTFTAQISADEVSSTTESKTIPRLEHSLVGWPVSRPKRAPLASKRNAWALRGEP